MILADKITEERKKNGWSQEELAEKLEVSRQAVSKWESAGSIPDLQRVVRMSELFGVSIDYLLKDDMEPAPNALAVSDAETDSPLRRVSMEEANAFLSLRASGSRTVANAVSMCILSPVPLIVLCTMAEDRMYRLTESLASAVGCVFLFGLISAAVYMFIVFGMREKAAEHLGKECFETEYGVSGMVREKKRAYEPTFTRGVGIGVVLCIVAVLPLIVAASMGAADHINGLFTGIMLAMIALGVNMIVRVAMVRAGYDTLLQEGDYTPSAKHAKTKTEALAGAYWCLVTAGYLGWSFATQAWHRTWIVWPIAGVLFGAISAVLNAAAGSDR